MWWWHGPGLGLFGWSLFPGHAVVFVLFWALVIFAIVGISRGSRRRSAAMGPDRPSGLDILEERYAKGEIPRDEYLQKKRDLIG